MPTRPARIDTRIDDLGLALVDLDGGHDAIAEGLALVIAGARQIQGGARASLAAAHHAGQARDEIRDLAEEARRRSLKATQQAKRETAATALPRAA